MIINVSGLGLALTSEWQYSVWDVLHDTKFTFICLSHNFSLLHTKKMFNDMNHSGHSTLFDELYLISSSYS